MKKEYIALLTFLMVMLWTGLGLAREKIFITIPENVGLSSERLKSVDGLMDLQVEKKRIAGAVILIARKGEVAYFKAFGNKDTDKAMEKDTLFRISSMTKPIISAAVMKLYEEGRILLSDPISKYIPEFKNPKVLIIPSEGSTDTTDTYKLIPAKREITIRHLLTHTSGLTYGFAMDWIADPMHVQMTKFYEEAEISDGLDAPEGNIGEMVKKLARLPLLFHPGEAWEYGLSYDILGYLVEVISGMSLSDYLYQNIFNPLKMKDTFFYPPKSRKKDVSALWTKDAEKELKKIDSNQRWGHFKFSPHYPQAETYYSGGAGLVSSAHDYFRFCQMLLNKGKLDGIRILSRKTVELMTAVNHIGDLDMFMFYGRGWGYGLGFAMQLNRMDDFDRGSLGVFEWGGIHATRFSVDPVEEKILIVMCQHQPAIQAIPIYERLAILSVSAIID